MKKLLHIITSPRQDRSLSTLIAAKFEAEYRRLNPDAEIDVLDLWKEPITAFNEAKVAARMTFLGEGALEGELQEAWNEVTAVTERFRSADEYLITVPMWNGGIPWILKQYIDTVTQPGLTFGFGKEAGFFPLMKEKKAVVVYTTAIYRAGAPAAFGLDFQSTYIEWWLRSVGISQVFPVGYYGNIIDPEKETLKEQAIVAVKQIAAEHFQG